MSLSLQWNGLRRGLISGYNGTAARVAPDINARTAHIEHSINGQDDPLKLDWQTNRLQNNHHHNEACMGDPGCAYTGQERGQSNQDLFHERQGRTMIKLSDEKDGDCFIKGRAIHVNRRPQGHDE